MSGSRPKAIQIFLPNGNPQGIRVARIRGRTVQAVEIPRKKLEEAGNREEVRGVGVYVLFGSAEGDAGKPPAYVGEAENCFERLEGHQQQKDFWTTAVTITSQTGRFTKAHAKRLEYDCYWTARDAQRFRLQNKQAPTEPHVPEPMLAELQDNFEAVQTLFATLGYPILDSLATDQQRRDREVLQCKGPGADARGVYTEDGLVVFEGSEARLETVDSTPQPDRSRRENLREEGTLVEEAGALVFTKDHSFDSPSGASGVVLGRSSNGWKEWKDQQGRTLKQIERE